MVAEAAEAEAAAEAAVAEEDDLPQQITNKNTGALSDVPVVM